MKNLSLIALLLYLLHYQLAEEKVKQITQITSKSVLNPALNTRLRKWPKK
jgi:hypothetical protein